MYFTSNDCLISLSGFNNLSSEVKGNTNQSFQTIAIIDNILYILLPSPFTVYIPVTQTVLSGIPSAFHYGGNILLITWILPLPAAIVYLFQSHELTIPIQSHNFWNFQFICVENHNHHSTFKTTLAEPDLG